MTQTNKERLPFDGRRLIQDGTSSINWENHPTAEKGFGNSVTIKTIPKPRIGVVYFLEILLDMKNRGLVEIPNR